MNELASVLPLLGVMVMKYLTTAFPVLTAIIISATVALAGPPAMIDTKEVAPTPHQIDWEPGDPLSFADGLGTFDVQIRERVELRDNWIDFNSKTNTRDDMGLLERLRLGLMLKPTDTVTLYGQLQDSRTFFDDARSVAPNAPGSQREFITNNDPIALRQLYAKVDQLFGEPVSLQLGRQVLAYGDERLIGGFDWDNNARTFDAARVRYQQKDYSVDAFAAYPVLHQSQDFDNPETNDLFLGLYASTTLVPAVSSDYYVLWRSKSRVDAVTSYTNAVDQDDGDPAADGDYATIGTRWKSKPNAFNGFDFGLEGALQVGSIVNPLGGKATKVSGYKVDTGRQDLLAGFTHVEGGYTVKTSWTPRVFTSFDYASGSDNPSSGTSNTFQNLYPTNHPLYGILDRFALSNMYQVTVGVTFKPLDNLTLKLDYHNTWLVSTKDEWRIANQTPLGSSLSSPSGTAPASGYAARYTKALLVNPSNYMGSEVDLIGTYSVTKWCKLQVGGAHFFAGDYIRETAPTQQTNDANFVYTQVQFDF